MYNAFFGLDSAPFRVNPDPRFLYMSESHGEALATLVYAVQERKGFITLTGEVGTGKTTILNALLQKLAPTVQTAYIFNTSLGSRGPVRRAVRGARHRADRAVPQDGGALAAEPLSDRPPPKGLQTLLIVDEAQNLSDAMLEEIRMLSNLETPESKLLQIMLVGQPELADKLSQPALRQLRQRVELRHAIRPLRAEETSSYIRERLLVAGHPRGELFTSAAERAVHRFARGIPRVVNVLCDNALIIGVLARGARSVGADGRRSRFGSRPVGESGRPAFRTRAQRARAEGSGRLAATALAPQGRIAARAVARGGSRDMGKIHDALQRAEQARRGERHWTFRSRSFRQRISHAAARRARPRLRSWSLRRKPSATRVAATLARDEVALPASSGSPYSEEYRTLRARIQSLRRTRELRTSSSPRPVPARARRPPP